MISLNNLTYRIKDQTLFYKLSGHFKKNRITGIVGESGSGKSTLFKLITGLIPFKEGEITLFEQSIKKNTPKEWIPLRQKIGYLLQHHALFLEQTVGENIFFNAPIDQKRLNELLDQLDLGAIAQKKAADLSGGMKKRVALARTISLHPELLLLDDPFSGLDPITTQRLFHILLQYQRKHSSTIVIAARGEKDLKTLCTDLYRINNGKLEVVC